MTVELSKLVFSVETKQLTEAIDKTQKLIDLQKELGKPTRQPSAPALGKGAGVGGSNDTKKQIDLLTKLSNLYGDLAGGASRWEASQLSAARKAGTDLDSVKKKLTDIRDLMPGSSFDPAIGAVRKMRQEFDNLTNRVELTKQGILLTKSELEAFGRIPFEVKGQMRSRGEKPEGAEYDARVASSRESFINQAKNVSTLRIAEKERLDIVKQSAAAEKFLANEMQRVDAVLGEMNSTYGLNVSTQQKSAEQVAKYAAMLKRTGIEGTEAALRLEKYRAKVSEIATTDKKRASERLSNALAPQISDIAVSIAGGMPLHLIAMQQGLQIRDLIGQSKIDVKDLDQVFRTSMSKMVTSIGGTVSALSSMAFGAVKDAGSAVSNFAMHISGVGSKLDTLGNKFPELIGGILRFEKALAFGTGVALVGFATAIGALVYEYVKLIGANNDLARSLATSAGSFKANFSSVQEYVQALERMGVDNRTAVTAITEMANAGNLTAKQITMVTTAALDMERYGGVAIKDTVKAFSEMSKDPIKALTELAIKSGDVPVEIVKMVRELKEQGKSSEASALAMQALKDHTTTATSKMKEDLHGLTLVFIKMKEAWSGWRAAAQKLDDEANAESRSSGVSSALLKVKEAQRALNNATSLGQNDKEISSKRTELELAKFAVEAERESLRLLEKNKQVVLDVATINSRANKDLEKKIEIENKYNLAGEKKRKTDELEAARSYMSDAEYKREKQKIEDAYTDKKVQSEINKEKAYGQGIQEKLNDAYNRMLGTARQLNDVEKAILDIRDDDRYKNASPKQRAEIEKQIAEKRKLIEASKDVANMQKEEADIAQNIAELRKKNYAEIADLYKELSVHGEKYEKVLLAINYAEMMGMDSGEAKRLRKENLEKNSNVKKSSDKFTDKFKEDREKIALSQADLDFERSMLGRTEKVRQYGQIQLDLNKKFMEIQSEYEKNISEINLQQDGAFAQKSLDEAKRVSDEKKLLARSESEFKKTLLSEEVQRQKNFDDTMKRGFESMGDALIDFAVTGKSSFGDMVKQMLIDLAKLEMRMQVMKLYESFRGGSGGVIGSLSSGGFTDVGGTGGIFNSVLGSILGGAFADGGDPPVNKVSLVGEEGPELFVPRSQGTIIPNDKLGGSKKVVNVSQTYNIQIDSRSDQASIYAGVQSMLKQNNAQLVDSLQTGGYI